MCSRCLKLAAGVWWSPEVYFLDAGILSRAIPETGGLAIKMLSCAAWRSQLYPPRGLASYDCSYHQLEHEIVFCAIFFYFFKLKLFSTVYSQVANLFASEGVECFQKHKWRRTSCGRKGNKILFTFMHDQHEILMKIRKTASTAGIPTIHAQISAKRWGKWCCSISACSCSAFINGCIAANKKACGGKMLILSTGSS